MAPATLQVEFDVPVPLRDGVRLPSALTAPLAGALRAVAERARPGTAGDNPEPVRPGSLGRWAGPVEAAGQ